ncbi:MAG: hypothetical protein IJX81_04915 [Clostridia bacterium]|nr:hypothetical protein [Clostridia bacterium]
MLDKREIMLNERDSLKELILTEGELFRAYAYAALKANRKEIREFLLGELKSITRDLEKLNSLSANSNAC